MADFAIIKTGGKQYKVCSGDTIKVEKLTSKDKKVVFDDIYGGKKVSASILGQGRHEKIRVLKFHPKKHYKRVNGHRQNYTSIKIESIS